MNAFFKILYGSLFTTLLYSCQESTSTVSEVVEKPDGQKIFMTNCINCHGANGKLGLNGAKDLTKSILPLNDRITLITNGKGAMTTFEGVLGPEQIKAVAEYSLTLNKDLE